MYVLQNAKLYVPWLCSFFAWASQKILSHKFASFPSFFGSFIYPWSTFWTQLAIWPDAKLRLNLILSLVHDMNCPSLYLPAAMQNRGCPPSDVMVRNSVVSINTVKLCCFGIYCDSGTLQSILKFFQTMRNTIVKDLTKLILVAIYTVSTIKNKEFEVDNPYYY